MFDSKISEEELNAMSNDELQFRVEQKRKFDEEHATYKNDLDSLK